MKRMLIDYLPMALAAAMIITFAVWKEQTFFKTLPTLITLAVQLLNVRVNRYAFLLGGINAVIYGIVYLTEGLYFSMISALALSAPIQLYAFINWGKNRTSNAKNELRFLSLKQRIWVIGIILCGWGICYFGLSGLFATARMPLPDTLIFSIGITVSVLAAMRYVDSQYINICSCTISIIMWSIICASEPENINYLIISFYNTFMIIKASVSWTRSLKKNTRFLEREAISMPTASCKELQ